MPAYPHPVSELLTLGRCHWQNWTNYSRLPFNHSHISALVDLARDRALMDHEDDTNSWAPVHAWRVLGIMADQDAVEPLLNLMWNETGDEFFIPEYLPSALGRMGKTAMPALMQFVSDACLELSVRLLAIDALKFCGQFHRSLQATIASFLKQILDNHYDDDASLNAHLIAALVDLGVKQAASSIEEAYNRGTIDHSILGDMDDVEKELSLNDEKRSLVNSEFDHLQERMLSAYLLGCNEKALSLTAIKGLMFAVANSPVTVPPDRWLTIALGAENPEFDSLEQGEEIRHILFNLLSLIETTITSGQEVLPEECLAEDVYSTEFSRLKEWSLGYGQGSRFLMDTWTEVLKHPRVTEMEESWSSCMILLNVWSNADSLLEKAKRKNGPDVGKMLSAMPAVAREMAVMSHDIRKIWQQELIRPDSVRVDKVGRNDPCPCGSGRKFKKCCGA